MPQPAAKALSLRKSQRSTSNIRNVHETPSMNIEENLPILVPAHFLIQAGYKLGDWIRLDIDGYQMDIIEGTIDGELFILDDYESEIDMFSAVRILH